MWSTEWQARGRAERQGGPSSADRGQVLGWQRQESAEQPGGLDRVGPRAKPPGDRLADGGPLIALLCPEPRLRRILRLALESDGYRLVEWSSMSRQVGAVEAIVVDLDGQGWRPTAALAALRAAGQSAPPALLCISVYPPEAGDARDDGRLEYLQPPFSPREFVARVGQLLRRVDCRTRRGPSAASKPPPTGELRPEARARDL